MDTTLINAYESVMEDMKHDTELDPEFLGQLMYTLKHRKWELENFDTFDTVEEN